MELPNYTMIDVKDFITFIEHPINQDKTFELINGYIISMSSPSSNHQRISGYIARKLGNYLENKQCEVFQDINVFLDDDVFRPDIIVGCDKSKMTDKGYEGIPEFIVEVISKTTAQYDYSIKLSKYMKYVKEYWIVDMFANQILTYINNGKTKVHYYTFFDKIEIFDTFIDFSEISKLISNT